MCLRKKPCVELGRDGVRDPVGACHLCDCVSKNCILYCARRVETKCGDSPLSMLFPRSGQVRSGLHASGEPVLGRRRKKHNMYTTAIYMRQKLTNEGKCEFHTTSSTSLHDPRFAIRMKFGFPSMSWTAHATTTNRMPR